MASASDTKGYLEVGREGHMSKRWHAMSWDENGREHLCAAPELQRCGWVGIQSVDTSTDTKDHGWSSDW